MDTNDAQVSTRPQHFVGYGYVRCDDIPDLTEFENKLCMVFDNAPRGYSRVYVREGAEWVGPQMVFAEAVVLTV